MLVGVALVLLALDLAGERRVQEYLPAAGRLPLVRDHELERQPALQRGTQAQPRFNLSELEAQMDRAREEAGPRMEEERRAAVAQQRRRKRAELAGETDQLSAELIALYERWSGPIEAEEENAIGRTLEEYHAKHRARLLGLFDRLVREGVMLKPDRNRPFFERPAHPGIIEGLPELLDEAAARLRLTDHDLAAWLDEQIPDFKSLAADLREQGKRPVPDIQRLDVIHDGFSKLTSEVAHRLRRDAKVWLDYWTQNPPGYNSAVTRIGSEQLLEEADFYEYAVDQLVFLRDQVG